MSDLSNLYRAISFAVLKAGDEVYTGPHIEWFVVDRPSPLDLTGRYVLDDHLEAEYRDGEDWAVEAVSAFRRHLSEMFTEEEALSFHAYLLRAHGVPLYTTPVDQPLRTDEDADLPVVLSDFALMQHKHREKTGDLSNGRISLHAEYGYDLPFKVAGFFQDTKLIKADTSIALSMAVD